MLKNFLFGNGFDNNRIQWIDNAKGICMCLVILVHSGYMPDLYRFLLEPFFLTLFFFISGYLFHNPSNPYEFKTKILTIIGVILIPYLFYWILSYTINHLIRGDLDFLSLLNDILMGNKLWFIAALFFSQIMFSILLFCTTNIISIILFAFGSVLIWYFSFLSEPMIKVPWSLNNSLIANFFIGIGFLVRIYNHNFLKVLESRKVGLLSIIAFLALVLLNFYYLRYPYNFPSNIFGNVGVFLIHALLGIFSTLFISNLITNQFLLMFIGANSLLFYFFQNQVLKVLKKIAESLGASSPDYILPIVIMVFAVLLLIIPILLTNKYLPIMAGKSKVLNKYL